MMRRRARLALAGWNGIVNEQRSHKCATRGCQNMTFAGERLCDRCEDDVAAELERDWRSNRDRETEHRRNSGKMDEW